MGFGVGMGREGYASGLLVVAFGVGMVRGDLGFWLWLLVLQWKGHT